MNAFYSETRSCSPFFFLLLLIQTLQNQNPLLLMPSNNRSREHQIPSLQLLKKATLTVFPPSSDQIKKTNLRLQFIYTQTPIHTPKKQNKTKKQGSRFTKDHLNHENLNRGPKITTNHYETSKQTPSTMQNIKKHQPGIKLD